MHQDSGCQILLLFYTLNYELMSAVPMGGWWSQLSILGPFINPKINILSIFISLNSGCILTIHGILDIMKHRLMIETHVAHQFYF